MRTVLDRLSASLRPENLFAAPPQLFFRPGHERCPHCGAVLKVRKTLTRYPVTLHLGPFTAHETVLICESCPDTPSFRNEELAGLVGPGRTFGYDVMTFAGEAILRRNRTVDETVAELERRNVVISPSEVRELAARFTVRLGIAHAESATRLSEHLRCAGGYILHLDSTTKGAGSHLVSGIDEISGFVLLNGKLQSENAEEIAAFLVRIKQRYGTPAAVSSDMSKGILAAVAATLDETPVYICHFHFLRDLGKDLLDGDYALLRARLRSHGVKAELKRRQRRIGGEVEAHADDLQQLLLSAESELKPTEPAPAVPAAALLGAFVTSILEAEDRGDGCGFPFDRPHLLFFRQAEMVLTAADALWARGNLSKEEQRQWKRLLDLLRPVCEDAELRAAAERLESKAAQFDRLRLAMRIAEPGTGMGLNDSGADLPIGAIKHNVESLLNEWGNDEAFLAQSHYLSMLDQIEKYKTMLFADPIQLQTETGIRTVQPQRTNNILERFFRSLSRQVCKRTGRQIDEAHLEHLSPDTPLVANLDNPAYCEILLNGAEPLCPRLAQIDPKIVNDTLKEMRKPQAGLNRNTRATLGLRITPIQIALHILKNAS